MTRRSSLLAALLVGLAAQLAACSGDTSSTVARQGASAASASLATSRMRSLNNLVLQLHGQMQKASPREVGPLRSQAAAAIAERAAALSTLIQANPLDALSFAFSRELLAELAAKFPQSAEQLESHATLSGPAQHWIADYPDRTSRSWWHMEAGGRSLGLYFAGPEPANLKGGEVLEVTGVVAGSNMAVETSAVARSPAASGVTRGSGGIGTGNELPGAPRWPTLALLCGLLFVSPRLRGGLRLSLDRALSSLERFAIYPLVVALIAFAPMPSQAQSSCSTTGVQRMIVILVNLPGATLPSTITPAAVNSMFFGATAPSLNSYWQETSYGLTSAAGDVYGPFTLAGAYSSSACQSLAAMQSDAMSAAAGSGANFQSYNRVVVVFPDALGCGWSGLSSIGCSSLNTPSGTINASSSYLSAAYAGVQEATHELGHALGLSHASSRGFTDGSGSPIALGPLGTTGNLTEYGDKFSSMSCCTGDVGGEYAAPHKAEVLGWLPPATGYQTVQASGSYTLQPYEVPGGLKAIKVQRGTGNNSWLWVEYRQPDGSYDAPQSSGGSFPSPVNTFLAPQPYTGALVHYEDSVTGLYSHLINYSPTDSSFFSPALIAGQSWTDPYSDLSLSVVSATASGLTVDVRYGSTPCTRADPTVTITPSNPSTSPGTGAGYGVSITSNDSSGCSAATFTPSSTQPAGFTSSFSAGSITLSPGQSGSLTMTQTPPAGTAPGTYAVSASASSSSYVGTGTANLTVVSTSSLSVTVSVSSSSYARKSTVPMSATVSYGGAPASGASVAFTLTRADGSKVTQTATASSKGVASWSYKLGPNAPTGTYAASAQASFAASGSTSTQQASSNTVSFTVQ